MQRTHTLIFGMSSVDQFRIAYVGIPIYLASNPQWTSVIVVGGNAIASVTGLNSISICISVRTAI